MAKENQVKKKKLAKKQLEETHRPVKKLKKKKKKAKKEVETESESDSGETPSDKLNRLLEPYTKEQLIDFTIDAASKDNALYTRIRDAADSDVTHRNVFVYGLGCDTTRKAAFSPYGEIEAHRVVNDATGKAKGFGFVLFKTRKGATKALKEPRKKICNRMATCELASSGKSPNQQQVQVVTGRKIYVSNVPKDADPEKLKALFAEFGEIYTGTIGYDSNTGKSRGFAVFLYKTADGAKKALQEPYKIFEGQSLFCKMAIDTKNTAGGAASAPTTLYPIPAGASVTEMNPNFNPMYPNFNPMYRPLPMGPNSGFLGSGSMNPFMGAGGTAGFGQGMYGLGQVAQAGGAPVVASYGLNSLGGGSSVMGSYGLNSIGGSEPVLGSYGLNSTTQPTYPGSYPRKSLTARLLEMTAHSVAPRKSLTARLLEMTGHTRPNHDKCS